MHRTIAAGLALTAVILTGQAPAAQPLGRYEARTIVTGTDMRSRPTGFAACLVDVLVKVSGDPALAHDARVAALAAHADRLVADYDYWDRMTGIPHHDEQGNYDRPYDLTVRFDQATVNEALAGLGHAPWQGQRPLLVPVLHVEGYAGAWDLTADGEVGRGQREAMEAAAERYDMPLQLPRRADLLAWRAKPQEAGKNELAILGTLRWSDTDNGWVGAWHITWQGRAYDWGIRGVNFDEAFRDAVRGAMRVVSGNGPPQ